MKAKIAYVVELTRDEALALCVLNGGTVGGGWLRAQLMGVARELERLDPQLSEDQFAMWKRLGFPSIDVGSV